MSSASVQSASVDAVEQPPQRRDPPGADGELDVGEQGGAGQLSGEVAGVGAQPDPPGPRRGRQRGQRPAQQRGGVTAGILVPGQQVRGQHGRGVGPAGDVRAPDPLALVVERHPALAAAVDLHIGGVQIDRHLLTQRRRTLGGQQRQRGRGDIAEPGLHRMPTARPTTGRASPAAVVAARSGTGASCCPAVSARWRSSPTRKSSPASCAAAIPTNNCPPVCPRRRCLIGPIAASNRPITSSVRPVRSPPPCPPPASTTGPAHRSAPAAACGDGPVNCPPDRCPPDPDDVGLDNHIIPGHRTPIAISPPPHANRGFGSDR